MKSSRVFASGRGLSLRPFNLRLAIHRGEPVCVREEEERDREEKGEGEVKFKRNGGGR